jgi:hypothetical protein
MKFLTENKKYNLSDADMANLLGTDTWKQISDLKNRIAANPDTAAYAGQHLDQILQHAAGEAGVYGHIIKPVVSGMAGYSEVGDFNFGGRDRLSRMSGYTSPAIAAVRMLADEQNKK